MSGNILDRINAAKSNYYDQNQKNSFFKNKQKFDCATQIMNNLNETEVFKQIFVFSDDTISFNYALFKTIAHPDLYDRMADFIFQNVHILLSEYPNYNLNLYCAGITVSGLDRYKEFVQVISNKGLKNGANLLQKLNNIYAFNPPSFLDNAVSIICSIIVMDLTKKIHIVK